MGLFRKRQKPETGTPSTSEMDGGDAEGIIREEADGQSSVRFYCGDYPSDEAIAAAGHEPNGYFWEGVLQFLDPSLADRVELDSESGMFAAYGSATECDRVGELLSTLLTDTDAITALIAQAEAAGHSFND